jgi:hypothetical protein
MGINTETYRFSIKDINNFHIILYENRIHCIMKVYTHPFLKNTSSVIDSSCEDNVCIDSIYTTNDVICGNVSRDSIEYIALMLETGDYIAEIIRKNGFNKYYISDIKSYNSTIFVCTMHRFFYEYHKDIPEPQMIEFSNTGTEYTDYLENEHIFYLHSWKIGYTSYPPVFGGISNNYQANLFLSNFNRGIYR